MTLFMDGPFFKRKVENKRFFSTEIIAFQKDFFEASLSQGLKNTTGIILFFSKSKQIICYRGNGLDIKQFVKKNYFRPQMV